MSRLALIAVVATLCACRTPEPAEGPWAAIDVSVRKHRYEGRGEPTWILVKARVVDSGGALLSAPYIALLPTREGELFFQGESEVAKTGGTFDRPFQGVGAWVACEESPDGLIDVTIAVRRLREGSIVESWSDVTRLPDLGRATFRSTRGFSVPFDVSGKPP
jgi:hypothetical protein